VIAGLQNKFSWSGVAAAGAGAGVSVWSNNGLQLSGISEKTLPGMLGGIAGAAATSLVKGRDFGDTIMAQLPSIIGNTIGNLVADGVASRGRSKGGLVIPDDAQLSSASGFSWDESAIPGSYESNTNFTPQQVDDRSKVAQRIIERDKAAAERTYSFDILPGHNGVVTGQYEIHGGDNDGRISDVLPAAYDELALRYDRTTNSIGLDRMSSDGKATNYEMDAARTAELRNEQFKTDVAAGIGLGVMLGPITALVSAGAASSITTFGLANAANIMSGTGIVGEIITGVPLMTPVAAGSGVALASVAERAPNTIVATERGVAMTSELLSLQGTSKLAGDFRGIEGARVEEIISRVPSNWTLASQLKGMGIRFLDSTGIERLRLHGPGARAPIGSNSAAGWTARVHVPGTKNSYYDSLGNIVGPKAIAGHIP